MLTDVKLISIDNIGFYSPAKFCPTILVTISASFLLMRLPWFVLATTSPQQSVISGKGLSSSTVQVSHFAKELHKMSENKGNPKTLTPGPWNPTTDRSTDYPYRPLYGPPPKLKLKERKK